MSMSKRNPALVEMYASTLATTTPEGSLVALTTGADSTVGLPSGASPTSPLLGLLYEPVATTNGTCQVVTEGVFPGIAGAGITRGAELTSNGTDGTVVTASPVGGTNCAIVGTAEESASSGERIAVRINPYIKQG